MAGTVGKNERRHSNTPCSSAKQWIQMMDLLQLWMVMSMLCCGLSGANKELNKEESLNFYNFLVMDITGSIVSLEEYKGKVSLVVNVASQCGYTDGHYKMLNLLQTMFEDTDQFTVLAFPCNQFGGQEPGNHHEIVDFVYQKMGSSFPVFAKVDVVNQDVNPAWNFLIKESGQAPTWNFWKYLVDHTGHVIDAWGPSVSPDQLYPVIKDAVDKAVLAHSKGRQPEESKKEEATKSNRREKDEF